MISSPTRTRRTATSLKRRSRRLRFDRRGESSSGPALIAARGRGGGGANNNGASRGGVVCQRWRRAITSAQGGHAILDERCRAPVLVVPSPTPPSAAPPAPPPPPPVPPPPLPPACAGTVRSARTMRTAADPMMRLGRDILFALQWVTAREQGAVLSFFCCWYAATKNRRRFCCHGTSR